MSANSDNPAGMSTMHLKRQLKEVKALVSELSEAVSGHGETIDRLTSRVNSLSNIVSMYDKRIQNIDDRLSDVEVDIWRYHEREKFVARLVAIGYTTEMAEETVDELFTNGCGNGGAGNGNTETEQGVALREQLATLNYTPTEIEECIDDVPGITQADIDYAKEILDAWDPATTSLANAYKDNTRLVIFPKLDTSNVTNMGYAFFNARNLAYIPQLDTSRVTNAIFIWGHNNSYNLKLKRVPAFDWSSQTNPYGTYMRLGNLIYPIPTPIAFPKMQSLTCTFTQSRLVSPYPDIQFRTDGVVKVDQFMNHVTADTIPCVDFPENVVQLSNTFDTSTFIQRDFSDVAITAKGCTDFHGSFKNVAMTHAPYLDMPMVERIDECFIFCRSLLTMPDYTAMSPMNMENMLTGDYGTYPLERVVGLNFARVTNATIFGTGTTSGYQKPYLRYMRIVNLGQSELTSYDFSLATVWGTGSEEARQSLVNTLLTDSYDRAAAGMTPATVRLSTASKAALTSEEIAAITAKGFTIA